MSSRPWKRFPTSIGRKTASKCSVKSDRGEDVADRLGPEVGGVGLGSRSSVLQLQNKAWPKDVHVATSPVTGGDGVCAFQPRKAAGLAHHFVDHAIADPRGVFFATVLGHTHIARV